MGNDVLYVGRFDIPGLLDKCARGDAPDNHIHGISRTQMVRHGIKVRSLALTPAERASSLAFQRRVMQSLDGVGMILCHSHYDVRMLSALRLAGVLKTPLAAFVHSHRPRWFDRMLLRGFDRLYPLTRRARMHLDALGLDRKRLHDFPFGADLSFYGLLPAPDPAVRRVLSVGVSGRDFRTLIDAARLIDAEVHIVGRVGDEERARAGSNVVVHADAEYGMPFGQLRDLYREASIVAVVHHATEQPYGLNGLVEAMGFGRAVVMTEGPGIDIDPASEGFGATVVAHDAAALAAAVNRLLDDGRLVELARQARALVESRLNTTVMADAMAASLSTMHGMAATTRTA